MEQRIKQIIEAAETAQNKAARYEGELTSILDKIEEICGTRDLKQAEIILDGLVLQNEKEEETLNKQINELEDLYERASKGEDISSEIERRQGTNTARTRKIVRRTRTNQ